MEDNPKARIRKILSILLILSKGRVSGVRGRGSNFKFQISKTVQDLKSKIQDLLCGPLRDGRPTSEPPPRPSALMLSPPLQEPFFTPEFRFTLCNPVVRPSSGRPVIPCVKLAFTAFTGTGVPPEFRERKNPISDL